MFSCENCKIFKNDYLKEHLRTTASAFWCPCCWIWTHSTYHLKIFPERICLFKNTRIVCQICSELISKTPQRHHWGHSGVFIAPFGQILYIVLVFHCYLWACKYQLSLTVILKISLSFGIWLHGGYGYYLKLSITYHYIG